MLRGIQPAEQISYFDKYNCVLLETMAEIYCFKHEPENARAYLREALETAKRYDTATPQGVQILFRGLPMMPRNCMSNRSTLCLPAFRSLRLPCFRLRLCFI